jgi:VWFA-related protein
MKSDLHQLVYRSLLCGLLGSAGSMFAGTAAGPAAVPPKKPEREDLFLETVNVSVVNVDVYATDKKGEPIRGLSKDDFEILENGKPVEITNFFAVEGGRSVAVPGEEPTAAEAAPGPPGTPRAEPLLPEDQRLRLIIYIDNFNLQPFNRNRVMRELRAFLGTHLGKGDKAMLVTYDRELHVRNQFTSDASLIANRLLELEKISAQGVHAASERRDALQKIQDSQTVTEAESYARTYAQSQTNDAEFALDGLKSVVNSMAGLPGRKALVYVSDGLQMMVGQDIYYAVHAKYSEQTSSLTEATQYDMSRRFRELTAQANANRVTFYTIDAAGLRSFSSTDASVQGPGPTSPGSAQLIDSMQIQNLQATLQTLAEETGGQVIMNSNSFMPGLEKMARDFGSYYSLGYTPPHFGDGRYYKIEVRLKKKNKDIKIGRAHV